MIVDLQGLVQPALIIPGKTGVVYTTQTGGTACRQMSLEGILIPVEYDYLLSENQNSLGAKISKLFPEGSSGEISVIEAKKLEVLLTDSPFTQDISIDWKKLKYSHEAWLYVLISGELAGIFTKSWKGQAVLTWPNSD